MPPSRTSPQRQAWLHNLLEDWNDRHPGVDAVIDSQPHFACYVAFHDYMMSFTNNAQCIACEAEHLHHHVDTALRCRAQERSIRPKPLAGRIIRHLDHAREGTKAIQRPPSKPEASPVNPKSVQRIQRQPQRFRSKPQHCRSQPQHIRSLVDDVRQA